MRYKGIEINEDWDLFIGVEFNGDEQQVSKSVFKAMQNNKIGVEFALDDYMVVVSPSFNFTKDGIEHLTKMYNLLADAKINGVNIEVNVQADDWVFKKDDDEYNADNVSLDEFLKNLED